MFADIMMCSGVIYCLVWATDLSGSYVLVIRLHTTKTCRQLGNDTTYDTEKKNPTSHDVADTSAVSGRRVGKTRHHVVKTNCGRHLKRRHFQLSPPPTPPPRYLIPPRQLMVTFFMAGSHHHHRSRVPPSDPRC